MCLWLAAESGQQCVTNTLLFRRKHEGSLCLNNLVQACTPTVPTDDAEAQSSVQRDFALVDAATTSCSKGLNYYKHQHVWPAAPSVAHAKVEARSECLDSVLS